jgi:O-antigen/teichoic acid export membrane protein
MSLKGKAVKSFSWTLFQAVFSQGFIFIVGVILARILSPEDFGIIGIITAFIAVTNAVVEGGFGTALIRKMDANNDDYNTVFYTNLGVSLFLYLLLYVTADQIALFFETPILAKILRYTGIVLIFSAVSLVQACMLTKVLNFKTLALISILASIVSGIVAILMAYNGYGIWSLVALSILRPLINSISLWVNNKWRPSLRFSKSSFKYLFNYGSKLLITNVINTIYKNIYYVVIGKLFSPVSLGYYTRAVQFQSPVSGNITNAINKISFPILATFQDDNAKLKNAFVKFLKFSIFINFTIMLAIAAMAKPIVLLLVGAKWATSIVYLQLLCVPGMLYPLQILHLNLLMVKGHSNLILKLEMVKKIILLPLIYFSVFFGIQGMIYALIIFSLIEYFINSYYTNWLIDYSIAHQLKDLMPYMGIALLTFTPMYITSFLSIDLFTLLFVQLAIGATVFIISNEIFGLSEYFEFRYKVFSLIKRKPKK